MRALAVFLILGMWTFCGDLNSMAESYVKLVLATGEHDPYFVDAYYGPEQWKLDAKLKKGSIKALQDDVESLLAELKLYICQGDDSLNLKRQLFLIKQSEAMLTRIRIINGEHVSFNEESKNIFDAVSPAFPWSYYDEKLNQLEELLPGEGKLLDKMEAFKSQFTIPPERLGDVFNAALKEAQKRTRSHVKLPKTESFKIEFIKGEPWAAYNWYKGRYHSLIQVNTDMDVRIDRAIDLACHEGYPGHHVYNVLLEKNMVNDRNWVEYSVYPLFSPQSLIAEGTANFGIEMVFSRKDRMEFERNILFPLAGLEPEKAGLYYQVLDLQGGLEYAGNDAARDYLDGKMTKEETLKQLQKYLLMTPKRAQSRIDFIDRYRSYVINYNLGQDLVRAYVNRNSKTPEKRWQVFKEMLSTSQVPSGLLEKP